MSKNRELQKHTIRLYEGQMARLKEIHPEQKQDSILRTLLDAYIIKRETEIKAERATIKTEVKL